MKALFAMRHAKSSWKDRTLDDHDRPLKKRGRRAAPRMGQLLLDEQLVPDLVVSSTARRAVETARAVAEACGYRGPVHEIRELYLAMPETHVAVLGRLGGTAERILVVGHNPGLEGLVEGLSGERVEMPTAAIALIHLPIDRWTELKLDRRGELAASWLPKGLDA
jgi:phosphohistidine phosphatase